MAISESRPDLTPEEFNTHIPSLSTGQIIQFIQKRLEEDPKEEIPLSTFLVRLNAIPNHQGYRELFTRRAMRGILIEGEPLDLSQIDNPVNSNGNGTH